MSGLRVGGLKPQGAKEVGGLQTGQPSKTGSQAHKTRDLGGGAAGGTVHMLICTLNYDGTGHELSCAFDGEHMAEVGHAAGVGSLTYLKDKDCTKRTVLDAIHQVATQCQTRDDCFVFFFAGHGMEVKDTNGDEDDGKDEAYVLMSETGTLDWKDLNNLMTDDEFTLAILTACGECPEKPQVLVLSDCCHSGTMCDFDKNSWRGYVACSISGCKDAQTSGDTSSAQGGICTSSICLAIESFNKQGKNDYSVNDLFKRTCKYDDDVYASEQDISLHSSSDMRPSAMNWPLIPKGEYTSPYSRDHGPLNVKMPSKAAPAVTYAAPAVSYAAPTSYAQPTSMAMPRIGDYSAPVSYGTRGLGGPVGYSPQQVTYAAPAATYGGGRIVSGGGRQVTSTMGSTPIREYASPIQYAAPQMHAAPQMYAAPQMTYAAPQAGGITYAPSSPSGGGQLGQVRYGGW